MDLLQAILQRKATRAFSNKTVSKQDVEAILNIAKYAPSWVNSQVQHVYVISGDKLSQIKKDYQIATKNKLRPNPELPTLSRNLWSKQGQNNMQSWNDNLHKNFGENWLELLNTHSINLYNVPTLLILTLPKDFSLWSLYDLGAFGQTLMLAAENEELATMPAYQFIKYPSILRKHLSIPNNEEIILGIGIGYADKKDKINKIKASRMNVADFTTFVD